MRALTASLTLLGLACAEAAPTDEISPDAIVRRDGGVRAPPDGGLLGRRDGGTSIDAGAAIDAGATMDAGASAATSAALYFASYNSGLGVEYLSAPHTVARDPRFTVAHVHRTGVAYGPNPRNLLDAWIIPGAPIAVFIHGGGFNHGSRDDLDEGDARRLLAAGISVATISYRWAYIDPALAMQATNPDDEGTTHDVNGARVDYILRDCARAIQFLRHRAAEWGVDATRIAAWGPSAGAGCATWVSTIDDLALPDHPDPVLRQSSRILAAGHLLGQPTYDWTRWAELLRMDPAFVEAQVEGEAARLNWYDFEGLRLQTSLRGILDYYEHMGPGDGAFYTQNGLPDLSEAQIRSRTQIVHHPRAHVALYERCVAAGLDCEIDTRGMSVGPSQDVVEFLIRELR